MSSAKTTTDHQAIQQWVEARGGHPARVKGTGADGDPGILRIDYPGFSGVKTLEKIDWDSFFEAFEANQLAFLFQDEPDSRFSKLIRRSEESSGGGKDKLDALRLLERQHRETESLIEQIFTADEEDREVIFAELADNLAAHMKIEESIFYPAVCDNDTLDLLHEAVADHLLVKRLVAEMLDMETDDAFMAKLEQLRDALAEHVEDEEQVLFPKVRAQDMVDVEVIGRKLERRFGELLDDEPRWQMPEETDAAASLPCE